MIKWTVSWFPVLSQCSCKSLWPYLLKLITGLVNLIEKRIRRSDKFLHTAFHPLLQLALSCASGSATSWFFEKSPGELIELSTQWSTLVFITEQTEWKQVPWVLYILCTKDSHYLRLSVARKIHSSRQLVWETNRVGICSAYLYYCRAFTLQYKAFWANCCCDLLLSKKN